MSKEPEGQSQPGGERMIDQDSVVRSLTELVREDRAEARIWRTRLETLALSTVFASFAVSGFLIGKANVSPRTFRLLTLLTDFGLIAVVAFFFWRVRKDLDHLRRAQRHRQSLLVESLNGRPLSGFYPFADARGTEPAIKDEDLGWLLGLWLFVVVAKMVVVVHIASRLAVAGHH